MLSERTRGQGEGPVAVGTDGPGVPVRPPLADRNTSSQRLADLSILASSGKEPLRQMGWQPRSGNRQGAIAVKIPLRYPTSTARRTNPHLEFRNRAAVTPKDGRSWYPGGNLLRAERQNAARGC